MSRFFATLSLLVVILLCWQDSVVTAQDGALKPWRLSYVYNDSARGKRPGAEFFDTKEEAERKKAECEAGNTAARAFDKNQPLIFENLKIEQITPTQWQEELIDDIRLAKDAVDTAKKATDEGLEALVEERKLGSTLKEYGEATNRSRENALKLRGYLGSMTGDISRQTFKNINREIANFNKQASAYNKLVSSPGTVLALQREDSRRLIGQEGFPQIDLVDEVKSDELAGKLAGEGSDSSSLAGQIGRLKSDEWVIPVKFQEDGTVVFGNGERAIQGRMLELGDRVTIAASDWKFEGKISGNKLVGTTVGRRNGQSEEWEIELKPQPAPETSKSLLTDMKPAAPNPLLGCKWSGPGFTTMTFKEDGTAIDHNSKTDDQMVFKWSQEGSKVTLTHIKEGWSNVLTLSADKNTLTGRYKYNRYPEFK